MTEAEWLRCGSPGVMLQFVRDKTLEQKLRLFACACCRRLAYVSAEPTLNAALGVVERLARCQASDAERVQARKVAQQAAQGRDVTRTPTSPKWIRRAASAVFWAASGDVQEATSRAKELAIKSVLLQSERVSFKAEEKIILAEEQMQADIARRVLGNPFRPSRFNPNWRTSTSLGIAESIYADRAFDRLPILADALQDAGCEDADILGHLRGDGPHVRGCWTLDLVLGKS